MNTRLTALQRNDNLLRKKFEKLHAQVSGGYLGYIEKYFDSLSTEYLDYPSFLRKRTKNVTEALRELWTRTSRAPLTHRLDKPETFEIFENFQTFEQILFQQEGYRAHYIHQFNVFLLGNYILNKLLNSRSSETKATEILKHRSTSPHFTWIMAATFHDMGYPIEQIDAWFSRFLRMILKVDTPVNIEVEKILTPSFFEYIKFLSEYHRRLKGKKPYLERFADRDWQFHNLLVTKLKKKDHGVISALLLIHSVLTQEKFLRDKHWFEEFLPGVILPACHAMSVHAFKPEEMEIDFRTYPYAFLLVLCDELQDWGRSVSGEDDSELMDIVVNHTTKVPSIDCTLRINNQRKIGKLEKLTLRLFTDDLIKITITDENRDRKWKLKSCARALKHAHRHNPNLSDS